MRTNKETQRVPSAVPSAQTSILHPTSYLGRGLQIRGEITGNEDLKLDSQVEGLVSIGGFRLTVGPGAHVIAEIVAREAVIHGEVTGNISACDRIEIRKTASVLGDMTAGKVLIEEGAYFKGTLDVDSSNSQIGTDLDSLLKGAKKVE